MSQFQRHIHPWVRIRKEGSKLLVVGALAFVVGGRSGSGKQTHPGKLKQNQK